LDEWDKEELEKMKRIFMRFDLDGSGILEADEMKKIAASLGIDTDTEEFRESMMALDFNGDNNISFTEFVSWWKIGRQNTRTLPKVYQLGLKTKEMIASQMDFGNYIKNLSEVTKTPDFKSNQKINYKTPGRYLINSFFECGLAVGGPMRTKMAFDFLSQFTKNHTIVKNNWISLLITLDDKQKKLNSTTAKALLDEFKENILCIFWTR
jgi:hypothetical protein